MVVINLNKSGYKAQGFEDGSSFFKFLKDKTPDLVILDLMLPDADGIEMCKFLKKEEKYSGIPVIMLTARTDEMEKVLGLEIGADDYITKPFSVRELMARVKAVMRRGDDSHLSKKMNLSDILTVDLDKYETFVKGESVSLTATEFKILKLLISRKGWVYSREQILDYLGVNEKGVLDRTVDVHIKNLREKLGSAGVFIKNIRGIGYKFELN